jgi:tetratricopeptide (TPR) repeat protein
MCFLWVTWFRNISKIKEMPETRRIVVADFLNTTGDQVFEGALEQAMCIGLEGAPFISIYKRGEAKKITDEISGTEDGKLDENLAQLVSRREGIALVVAGIIESKGTGYNIKVWAIDPVNQEKVMEDSESIKRKEQVFRAVDNLSEKLRSNLEENIKDSSQRGLVETFTTKSIESMKAYAHAQDLQSLGKYNESIEYYKKAIENDPDFGRAYSGLAVSSSNLGKDEDAYKFIETALSHLDRMNEREKLKTRGWHFLMKRNYEKAKEEYSMLAEQFPADIVAHINLSVAFWGLKDYEAAIKESKIVAELAPNDAVNYYNLCEYAWLAGEFELSIESGKKVWEINPEYEGPYLYFYISSSQVVLGQPEEAEETLQLLKNKFPDNESAKRIAERGFLNLALYEGRLNDAKSILKDQINSAIDEERSEILTQKEIKLAEVYMLQENKSLAMKTLDGILPRIIKEDDYNLIFDAAYVYLKSNLLDKAASLAKRIDQPRDYKEKLSELWAKALAWIIKGEINTYHGNGLKAEEEFGKAIKLLSESKNINDRWIYRYNLGYVYLKKDGFTEAHSEFELCLKRIQEAKYFELHAYIPLVHYYLGKAQEGLKSPAAMESYIKFLDMKKRGHGDILVEDAKKRLNELK